MDFKIKEITWKQSEYGSHVAYCGGQKIGWIKNSLTNQKCFYPSIFSNLVILKKQEYTDVEEAKKAIELAFNQIVSKFIETP